MDVVRADAKGDAGRPDGRCRRHERSARRGGDRRDASPRHLLQDWLDLGRSLAEGEGVADRNPPGVADRLGPGADTLDLEQAEVTGVMEMDVDVGIEPGREG